MLAHRLLAMGRAIGLYFALPTMATANAMFDRIDTIAPRLYADGALPSLALAHRRAALHPRFRFRATMPGFDVHERPETDGIPEEAEGPDSTIAAPHWLMSESRKALLADLGVGTIDQAILAVLPTRFQSVRLAGLAGKVLIVDEAHSYDAYVSTELDRLVAFHATAGGSTIILSATLPLAVRSRLIASWRRAVGGGGATPDRNDYPGATLVARGRDVSQQKLAARPDLCRTIALTRVPDAAAALERIRAAAAAGACVAWIRNTVDDAIEGAASLAALELETDLFHARFAMGDRLAIEERVLDRFGKKSKPEDRCGRIVVGTQVLEQSLDIDFDLIVSDLAPIDLLLQRVGRLWRHTERARPIPGPEFVVVTPSHEEPVAADWARAAFPRASAVYFDHAVLWRTAREIATCPTFRVPEDVRNAIEAVYALCDTDIPEALRRGRNEAIGKTLGERAVAEMNLLDPATGYRADVQGWQIESKITTQLAEESRTVRLARVVADRLLPWHSDADPRLAWALSEVTAYERKLQGRYMTDLRFRDLADAARVGPGWSRHDGATLLLPLEEREDGVWEGVLVDDEEKTLGLAYSLATGLRFG